MNSLVVFGAGYCNVHMKETGIGKAAGRRFGTGQDVALDWEKDTWEFSKMNERRGNVYENKGPLWKTRAGSGNVAENKGSYASKAGMSLKRKEVGGRS